MGKSGIYLIKSTVNSKIYVGSACNIKRRIRDHKRQLLGNSHPNKKLQSHYNKYGHLSLSYTIVEYCDKINLLTREQYWIDTLKPTFNICQIAGNTLGFRYKMSDKTKIAISIAKRGKKRLHSVKIYKGGDNIQAKQVERIALDGEIKTYSSLSSVKDDGYTFQNVYRAIKRGHKHRGYIWRYKSRL